MALITDYTSLQAAIGLLGKRKDITDNADMLIQLAETDIFTDLAQLLAGSTDTTLSTVANQEYVDLPAAYAGGIRKLANQNPAYELRQRSLQQLRATWDQSVGYPEEFALGPGASQGTYRLFFRAIPDAVYSLDMTYSAMVDPLSTTSSNWLLSAHPTVYLFGALRHAAAFAIEDDRIPLWQAAYSDAVRKAKLRDEDRALGVSPTIHVMMGMTP